jgi:prepilin-type processing-associated H-X9-DG protein
MLRPARRRAATLVEVLVTLAIFVALLAVLLPAVQSVRTAAARVQCQSHLRQIALGLHTAHDADGRFPPGTRPDARAEQFPWLSWHPSILPYLEQDPLARVVESGRRQPGNGYPRARPGQDTVVPLFGCPADDRVRVAWRLPDEPTFVIALTSYLGNGGTEYRNRDGVLYLNSRVGLLDVTDGTSNTLLVGERPPTPDVRYGWWYHGIGQNLSGSLDSTLGARERNRLGARSPYSQCERGPHRYKPGRLDNLCDVFHFWSLHGGGANFAFCDGSVRFLPYSADSVLPALATRAGGEVAQLPD